MGQTTLREALEATLNRNAGLREAYRSIARKNVERSVAGLARTCAEQREGLAAELEALAGQLGGEADSLELAIRPSPPPPEESSSDAESLLNWIREVERADQDWFLRLSAALGNSTEASQRLANLAGLAGRRVALVQDQLDLMALG
jgi:hypothetical protein